MFETVLDSLLDVLKSTPILLAVYLLIEISEQKFQLAETLRKNDHRLGPIFGALLGCIPQCGFSAASAALYSEHVIGAGTLIAVFLSTSDEAIPVLLANPGSEADVLKLLVCKIMIAVAAGYFYRFTVFRKEKTNLKSEISIQQNRESKASVGIAAVRHTLKTVLYLVLTLVIIDVLLYFLGEDRLDVLLLNKNFFQPCITALIGLIPGCSISVLLTEFYIKGAITFGSAVAGLSTGAGLGLVILFKQKKNLKKNLLIVGCLYVVASAAGIVINLIL